MKKYSIEVSEDQLKLIGNAMEGFYVDETNYLIYEQARENLALELIELYKNK